MATRDVTEVVSRNEVHLVGRFAAPALEREMPSGDVLCTFRVSVERESPEVGSVTSRQRVDALECATWNGRVRRSALTWQPGDEVEVVGALRRRFFRTAGGTGSRVEVEVTSARRLRRARTSA